MGQKIREDVLRRLLVSKHFLASASGQLTPDADAVAVARMILTAHDAAELAVAAIADHLGVPGLSGQMYLMEYPAKIKDHVPDKGELLGTGFLKQLNSVRSLFKHQGILPNARDWYRVIERTWDYVDSWCQVYLGQPLDEIDLEELLDDSEVRGLYQRAKRLHADRRYREALEYLGIAFYKVLDACPGILYPVLGKRHPDHALMLATYGVRASDFLSLQEFLPEVSQDRKTGELLIRAEKS